ncbi:MULTISPECIES: UvrD-helicase domain-containing protein [unclassified Variovorax]|uniref:UvrD-helicase domain-containing protein n=1 Tax=unclassified Variovorax TaxID=663243 RepID=UPI00076DE694|nr:MULTISPECIES: UvrD-helicase domain-containing protein [unclassified Variovorax]KWT98205.1 hypothetical protein APY03_0876 [Variovorax sp. WDL1]PNG50301.1 ATP-dependent helicase/nuclease subunit A [Variovorax sp. B2]PNG51174.1 ATP-dependent helicase/nuclease subunit A [Variovorax sp. B4]VTV17389.1 ATP-dependent helicase/nuclease subunit A [Variovorax sp. WDL1]
MNPVEFISAGAGSGKTYRLTSILSEALLEGNAPVRPHAVLATTFTVKAATELRERVRTRLLEHGRMDLVTAIGQARIGTVNSVCGQLLERFCFEMGLSPDQTVLSEAQTKKLLARALDDTFDPDRRAELLTLMRRLGMEDASWSEAIGKVLKAARENDISREALRPMGATNADRMLENWPAPEGGVDHTARLLQELATAKAAVAKDIESRDAAGGRVDQVMRDGLEELERLHRVLKSGNWNWPDWLAACNVKIGAKLVGLVQPVVDAAQAHERHPQFHEEVRRYLDLVFSLAADTLDTFRRAKEELGAVDFIDQEVELLRALRESEAVREALASELDLVLVDEFQDTSPLQLALFVEVAKLAKRSVWVGDPKQAIYGFRGTDASLIAGVIGAIQGWGGIIGDPLTESRRSTPALVSLANAVFLPAFAPDLEADAVKLTPTRDDIPGQPALYDWTFESRKGELDYLGLGPAITELLASRAKVYDKGTKELRAIRAGDIAVLCRTNDQIDFAAAALARWSIPSASGRPGLLSTPEALLVTACLRRLQDPTDTVATALILTLAAGMPAEEWLGDRLDHLAAEKPSHEWKATGEDAHPLLARLEELRPSLLSLTPSEALRLAKAESHVAMLASAWSRTPQEARVRIDNVEALLAMATTYESECVSSKQPASVGGLLRWLSAQAAGGEDARAAAADDAVAVLTHHGAKGLEWPVAILTGLGAGARTAVWDVRARTNAEKLDPQEPLRDRFIHCWPRTFGKRKAPQAALNAENSQIGQAMAKAGLEENKRLLYVSMTRARDALVLVSAMKTRPDRSWVDEVGASELLFGESGVMVLPDGRHVQRETKLWSAADCAAEPPAATAADRSWFSPAAPLASRPLWHRPSTGEGAEASVFAVGEVEAVGTRIAISKSVDMVLLGTALHHCIARSGVAGSISGEDVERLLTRWDVAHAVDTGAVVGQVDSFLAWIAKRWPGCPVHVEVPIEVDREDGTRLRGRIDFLVDTPAGWVLIDHKSNPRGATHDEELVREHGPQLASYADALVRATGRPVTEQWLFLPVAARALRVRALPSLEVA